MKTNPLKTLALVLAVSAGASLGNACGSDEARPTTTVIPTPTGGLGGSVAAGGNLGAPGAGGAASVGGSSGGGAPSADASDTDVSVANDASAGGSPNQADASTGLGGAVADASPVVEAGLVCDPYSGSYDNASILQYLPGGVLPAMP